MAPRGKRSRVSNKMFLAAALFAVPGVKLAAAKNNKMMQKSAHPRSPSGFPYWNQVTTAQTDSSVAPLMHTWCADNEDYCCDNGTNDGTEESCTGNKLCVLDCETQYCYVYNASQIGNGVCDAVAAYEASKPLAFEVSNPDLQTLACSVHDPFPDIFFSYPTEHYWLSEGGDCDGVELPSPFPDQPDEFVLQVRLGDSYGDGWSGNSLTLQQGENTLGPYHVPEYLGEGGYMYLTSDQVTPGEMTLTYDTTGGTWQSENYFAVRNFAGDLLVEVGLGTDEPLPTVSSTSVPPVEHYQVVKTICVQCGCTDETACNFDPTALFDDGSCDLTSCVGCMDSTACNFNAQATTDDGSCEFDSCKAPTIQPSSAGLQISGNTFSGEVGIKFTKGEL